MSIKRFKEMNDKQKKLYVDLADVIEAWANKNDLNKPEGVRQIFEVLVTLTLALKALYLMKKEEKPNEVSAPNITGNTDVSSRTPEQATDNN